MEDAAQNAPRPRGRKPNSQKPVLPTRHVGVEMQSNEMERPPLRPAMREEDPRASAARRAAEIRGHLGDLDEGTDQFALPPSPDGWTYEWKRKSTLGAEDHAHILALKRMGWTEVPADRHPDAMPDQGRYSTIERKGMILMERPTVITEELRALELKKARNQVRAKEEQLNGPPEGGLGHRDHAQVKPKINKGYSPIEVPKE
jgi:hypothetical protein